MFTEEEIKPKEGEGEGNPAPASGEEPETPETPTEPQAPTGEEGAADQSAEIENLKNQVQELQGLSEKQKTQLDQAGFNIQKYKEKLKEAGIDTEEQGISEDKIQEIVGQAIKPLLDQIQKMGQTMSEIAKASQAKPNPNPGGAGQKPPQKPKEPELPPNLQNLGLKWTGKGRVFKSEKTGRIYDLDESADEQ